MLLQILKLIAAAGVLLWAQAASAQCTPGTVLWVSDAVNANVGLASGSAACTATVAGAAYNSSGSPFGIQAAFDCSCDGAEIRILAGANNYGSASNSWNNRTDATKRINILTNFPNTDYQVISGWVDDSTQCTSATQANCPVVMDFTGGTGDGFEKTGGATIQGVVFMGLRITGVALEPFDASVYQGYAFIAVEVDNNGTGNGIEWATDGGLILDSQAHDIDLAGVLGEGDFTVIFSEFYDNGTEGLDTQATNGMYAERVLLYGNGQTADGNGFRRQGGRSSIAISVTAFDNGPTGGVGGSGYDGATGTNGANMLMNLIGQANEEWGVNGWGEDNVAFYNLIMGNNPDGAVDPAGTPDNTILAGELTQLTEIVTFGGATDFTATGFDPVAFRFPDGVTTYDVCAGATPTCAERIFVQPVRKQGRGLGP